MGCRNPPNISQKTLKRFRQKISVENSLLRQVTSGTYYNQLYHCDGRIGGVDHLPSVIGTDSMDDLFKSQMSHQLLHRFYDSLPFFNFSLPWRLSAKAHHNSLHVGYLALH